MILPINDSYRLAADHHSWAIQRKRKREGKSEWSSFLWYSTLETAINGLAHLELRVSDASTLEEALIEVERIAREIVAKLEPSYELRGVRTDRPGKTSSPASPGVSHAESL